MKKESLTQTQHPKFGKLKVLQIRVLKGKQRAKTKNPRFW